MERATEGLPVRLVSPEEQQLERYLQQIEALKAVVAERQMELASITAELNRFDAEYHSRVATRFATLDRIHLEIDEYRRRHELFWLQPDDDPATIEKTVDEEFEERHERIREEEQEAREHEATHRRNQERPTLEPAEQDEARRLYLELSKRYHPDLAPTEEERVRRAPIMSQVNEAFRDRNLAALRALSDEGQLEPGPRETASIGDRLVWAIREIARLEGVIQAHDSDLASVKSGELHELWLLESTGGGAVNRLVADLEAEIASLKAVLAAYAETYRDLLRHRDNLKSKRRPTGDAPE